jgi:hypothetical protein
MSEENEIDPKHSTTRTILRTLGPTIAVIGLVLIVISMVNFFSSFGGFEPPKYFWCGFLGIPLLFVGMVMTQYGFLGSFLRYFSGEAAPVQKDTFNYLAEGTKGGIKTVATAVGEGLAVGKVAGEKPSNRCLKCDHINDPDARFCKNCGSPFPQSRV